MSNACQIIQLEDAIEAGEMNGLNLPRACEHVARRNCMARNQGMRSHQPFSEYSTRHLNLLCYPFLDVLGLSHHCTDSVNVKRKVVETYFSPRSSTASRTPSKASVWCSRASIASIYPLGGPRFREGPRNVHATDPETIRNMDRRMTRDYHVSNCWVRGVCRAK